MYRGMGVGLAIKATIRGLRTGHIVEDLYRVCKVVMRTTWKHKPAPRLREDMGPASYRGIVES